MNSKSLKKVFTAILPGLIVAGLIFSTNVYYDLDLGRVIVEEITKIIGRFETTATTTLATLSGYVGIATSTPTEALTVSGNILATNNLMISGGQITGANSESLLLGVSNDIVNVIRGGATYIVCDSSGNCAGNYGYVYGTGTVNYIPKFTATSTIGNSIITDNGNLVTISGQLQTTGTTTLATSAGNVGIGTTNPASLLEIYKTDTSPILTITSATSNTAYGPYIAFRTGASPTTQALIGIDYSDSNKLKIVRGSDISTSTGLTINSSGYVGIGTTTPAYKLDVAGNLRVTGQTNFGGVAYTWPSSAGSSGQVLTTDGTGNLSWTTAAGGGVSGSGTQNYLAKWTAATTLGNSIITDDGSLVTISGQLQTTGTTTLATSGGNVGIGTTAPSYKLTVSGGDIYGSNNLYISGSVGIGTTNPGSYRLYVTSPAYFTGSPYVAITGDGSVNNASIKIGGSHANYIGFGDYRNMGVFFGGVLFIANQLTYDNASSTYRYAYSNPASVIEVGLGDILFKVAPPGTQGNPVTPSTALYISNSGNVGIGTSAPLSKLDVNGGVAIGSYAGSNAAPSNGLIVSGNVGIGTTAPSYKLTVSGGDIYGSNNLYISGNVGIGTTAPLAKLHVNTGGTSGLTSVLNRGLIVTNNLGARLMLENTSRGANNKVWVIHNDDDNLSFSALNDAGNAWISYQPVNITRAGNVGIGTSAPGRKLDVIGELSVNNNLLTQIEGGLYYGRVRVSENQWALSNVGATWVGRTGAGSKGWSSVSLSSDGKYQTAGVYNGYIYTSSDYGVTWTERTGAGSRNWTSVSLSSDGKYQTAVSDYIYTSSDYGVTWATSTGAGSRSWRSVSISSDGKYQTAVVNGGYIYTSSDYGVTWTERTGAGSRNWYSVSLSSDGKYQTAVVSGGGYIYTSSDYGVTWTERTGAGSRNWYSVSLSSDGKYQTVVVYGGYIYTSSDYGATWATSTGAGSRNWSSVSLSSDGKYQTAVVGGGYIYTSSDYGVTWTERTGAGSRNWTSVSLSSDGKYQTAVINGGYIYTSFADSYVFGGNVGIGTTAPSEKLTVAGNVGIQAGANAFIGTLDNYALSLRTNNTDRIYITNAGNVGIGTTTPAYKLTVNGDLYVSATSTLGSATSTPVIFGGYIQSNIIPFSDNAYTLGAPGYRWANVYAVTTTIGSTITIGSNTFEGSATTTLFTTGNTNQLVLGANGNVGIGTSAPSSLLELYQTTASPILTITSATSTTYSPQIAFRTGAAPATNFTIGNNITDNTLKLVYGSDISTSTGLTINSSGYVGIGTTTPAYKLDVAGNLRVTGQTNFGGVAYTWPSSAGSSGQVLTTDGTGNLSWTTISGGESYWVLSGNYLYTSSTAWNVGIGTTTPSSKLTVSGDLFVTATTTLGSATSSPIIFTGYTQSDIIPYSDLTYNLGSSSYRWANLYVGTTTIGSTITIGSYTFQGSATTTLFTTGNSNQLVLGANGYVGIGTSTPASLFSVYGTSTFITGNVGIGTTDVTAKLSIQNIDNNQASLLIKQSGSLFQKTIGGTGNDYGYSIQQTSDGGYVITGETYSFGAGSYDVFVIKLDSSGNLSWAKTIGGTDDDYGYSIQQTSDGGYVITGATYSFGAGGYDVFVIKLNSSGNLSWAKTIGGTGNDSGYSIQQTSDGGYVITGETYSFGAGSYDVFVIKLDSSGNLSWAKTIGGTDDDYGYSIQQTSDGGYVITGIASSFGAGGYDVFVIKLDSSGNIPGCSSVTSTNPTVSSASPTVGSPSPNVSSQSLTATSTSPTVSSQNPSTASQCSATSNFTPLVLTPQGRLAIGVTSTQYQLEVAGKIKATQICLGPQCYSSIPEVWWQKTGNNIVYNAGNVGIGTTTPAYKLDVNGTLGATLTQSASAGTAVHINLTTREIYAYTSSLRFKHDITDLEIDSSKIFDLRPVSYTPNDSDRRDFGLIAEEVASILPELVLYDAEGKPTAVRYEQLSVLLLNEMKKQKKEIEELKLAINEYGNLTQNGQELVNSQSANSLTETIKQLLEKLGLFIENGIAKLQEIIAEKLTANIVVTNQLCVGKVCVDETKFKELLEKNGIEPIILENSSSTTSTTESSTLTTDTSTTATPTVSFIGSPYFGTTSQPLTFLATTTGFTTSTLIFNWDFGDETSTTTETPSVSHTYNATGTFTLILSVQGGDQSALTSAPVQIEE